MKRYFIILIALIVLCALPVFAGTPTPENATVSCEEDTWLWLNSLSEEELMGIFGQIEVVDTDGKVLYNSYTNHIIDSSDGKIYDYDPFQYERLYVKIKKNITLILAGGAVIAAGYSFIMVNTIPLSVLVKVIGSAYGFTESLNAFLQGIFTDNVVTITGALIDAISSFLAEQLSKL